MGCSHDVEGEGVIAGPMRPQHNAPAPVSLPPPRFQDDRKRLKLWLKWQQRHPYKALRQLRPEFLPRFQDDRSV